MYEEKSRKKIVAGLLVAFVAVIALTAVLLGGVSYFWLLRFSTVSN